jgi:hypothetical protein
MAGDTEYPPTGGKAAQLLRDVNMPVTRRFTKIREGDNVIAPTYLGDEIDRTFIENSETA